MLLEAPERQSAQWFLAMFTPPVARQGKQRFSRGEIGSVWLVRDGQREMIPVENRAPALKKLKTELLLDEGEWDSDCSCQRDLCEHSYAAMLALLKHSDREQANGDAVSQASPEPRSDSLHDLLAHKLRRALKTHEKEFFVRFTRFHDKFKKGQPIAVSDLQGILDIYWNVPNLEPLQSKRDLPPRDFWQEFALFCAVGKYRLPDYTQAITDRAAIDQVLADLRRKDEIDKWKNTFAQLPLSFQSETSAPLDLAVMIASNQAKILVQTVPGAPFKNIGSTALQSLLERLAEGALTLHPSAIPIFNGFLGGANFYSSTYFSIDQPAIRCLLSNLFRNPELKDRLLTEDLMPFERVSQPLEWRLSEADNGDYKLQLTHADGKPAPKEATVLPGRPCLYLTSRALYEGPPKPKELSFLTQRIPAPALESNEGLGLLAALKLPIPERIQARTRNLRLDVVIRCKLRTPQYSNTEQCFFDFLAGTTETGLRERYSANGWHSLQEQKNDNGLLYIFDRAALEPIPLLTDSIGAAWDHFENHWRVRVAKNFPEKFLAWYQEVPKECAFELDPELASLVRDPVKARVHLECEEVGVDWFDLRTTVNVDDTNLTADEIRLLLNAKGKAVRIAGKGWRRLEYELTDEEDQSLARLGLSPHDFSAEPQRLHALQLSDRAAEKMLAAEQYQRIRDRASEIKTRVTPALPSGITATLRPYQTDGFHFLAYLSENNFGGILADDMGLGKTVQTLTWLEWLRPQQTAPKPSLVVCPKSVMENWRSEAAKFAPQLRVQLWRGLEGDALAKTAAENDLLVLNYSQLRTLAQNVADVSWHVVILDEAQYIKNPDSQTAQAARALRAGHRLALSGTPIENRLLDLWSIMAFAMPGVLGNRADFKRRFDQQSDPFARRRLSARVRPFLLRRTKKQVASELPDRIEEDIVCELEGVQKTLYRAEFKRAQQLLLKVKTQAELNEFRFNFLTSLLRLRQICCHPALIDDQHKNEESAKLNALVDLLDPLMEEGNKVLVFSQFVEMLQIIRARINLQKWPHYYLDGSSENRGDLVQAFQQHEGAAVFLISLKAGGFGLNLTAASYVVLYDPWWNPAVENQAIDRTHRIGQTQKVIAYRLLTKTSIEEKIRGLQKQKGTLAENVLGDESFASSLTIDDLRFLFEDDEQTP